jgi:hypothetical protein
MTGSTGHEVGAAFERQQGLFVALHFAERFAQDEASLAIAVHECAAALERAEGVVEHAELAVALGFFDSAAELESVSRHLTCPAPRRVAGLGV